MDSKVPFGPYNKQQISNFLMKLLMPSLKRQLQAKPKTFWNWTMETRVRFVSKALGEILKDPKNAVMKNIIDQTPYKTTDGFLDMPYYQLAVQLQHVV